MGGGKRDEGKRDEGKRLVLTTDDFYRLYRGEDLSVYSGNSQEGIKSEKAWWIGTNHYRVRLRASKGQLYLSDLRVYNQNFTDPYLAQTAKDTGRWLVPSLLKSSMKYVGNYSLDPVVENDALAVNPERIILEENITDEQLKTIKLARREVESANNQFEEENNNSKIISEEEIVFSDQTGEKIVFKNDEICFLTELPGIEGQNILKLEDLKESDPITGEIFWQMIPDEKNENCWQIQINKTDLDRVRADENTFSIQKSVMKINNRLAMAGRNPVRIIFYPRNADNEIVYLDDSQLEITADNPQVKISVAPSDSKNGMIFVDFESEEALKTKVYFHYQDYNFATTIYFAPNCYEDKLFCLIHFRQGSWFVWNMIADKIRLWRNS